ncbi:hypothetical protein GTZ99_10065 [Novosphingobium sp. FSY-8]|uniref:Glycosyl transferase family 1 n=1 Tax=Novosphingobium ovatum TaxID=1908523 RepID=A0ABW9XEN7_9SPHN|nr:hypothetical protein [Novosphingobium ovatum]NBC36902.1 hypothetical protein [Novosphingobium ovatum]
MTGMERLPSTDLYFRNACGVWLGLDGLSLSMLRSRQRNGRAHALSANSYAVGDWLVLVRRDTPLAMGRALRWHGRVAYVMDDDFAAGAADPHLPRDYARRLGDFARDWLGPLLARADVVLAASDPLADRLGGAGPWLRRIDPVWGGTPADTAHYAPLAAGGTLQIAHLGSASHGAALARVAPAVLRLLDRAAAGQIAPVRFTYMAAAPVSPALEHHPLARRIEPMTWSEYRRWIGRQRFHLALYPLLAGGLDGARSAAKLGEHGVCGAVGVYPAGWAPGAAMAAEGAAWAAPDAPADWADTLDQAQARRGDLAAMAAAAARRLNDAAAADAQRALWTDVLGGSLAPVCTRPGWA